MGAMSHKGMETHPDRAHEDQRDITVEYGVLQNILMPGLMCSSEQNSYCSTNQASFLMVLAVRIPSFKEIHDELRAVERCRLEAAKVR